MGTFRAALPVRAGVTIEKMKLAAAQPLPPLIPDQELAEDNIIPKPFHPRVVPRVAQAVADAARRTGVSRICPTFLGRKLGKRTFCKTSFCLCEDCQVSEGKIV